MPGQISHEILNQYPSDIEIHARDNPTPIDKGSTENHNQEMQNKTGE